MPSFGRSGPGIAVETEENIGIWLVQTQPSKLLGLASPITVHSLYSNMNDILVLYEIEQSICMLRIILIVRI